MAAVHTHVCRCGDRYECQDRCCDKQMVDDGDGCCPRHEAEWAAAIQRANTTPLTGSQG